MSNNKKENYKIRKYFARIAISFTAALAALGLGNRVKQLNEPQPIMTEFDEGNLDDIDKLYKISETDVPIDFKALDNDNMGKYFAMYYNAFMEKYPDFSKLVNEGNPSINTELVSKHLLGFLKAYYADLSGKEFPFDENNFSLQEFNTKVEIKTYQNWFKKGGDGLYLNGKRIDKFEDGLLLAISNQYIEMAEKHQYDNAYLSRVIYNVLAEKIGLKDRPTSEEIYNAIKVELQGKDTNEFNDRIKVDGMNKNNGENTNNMSKNEGENTNNIGIYKDEYEGR